jgi:hypothetical protein
MRGITVWQLAIGFAVFNMVTAFLLGINAQSPSDSFLPVVNSQSGIDATRTGYTDEEYTAMSPTTDTESGTLNALYSVFTVLKGCLNVGDTLGLYFFYPSVDDPSKNALQGMLDTFTYIVWCFYGLFIYRVYKGTV